MPWSLVFFRLPSVRATRKVLGWSLTKRAGSELGTSALDAISVLASPNAWPELSGLLGRQKI